jgi:hypothetical protein
MPFHTAPEKTSVIIEYTESDDNWVCAKRRREMKVGGFNYISANQSVEVCESLEVRT